MNQETVTYHLKNLETILSQPDYIKVQEFLQLYNHYSYLGVNMQILKLLEYYFYINIRNSNLIKYIYIIDQILNSSLSYQIYMPIKLGKLFSHCYHQYYIRGQKNQLQELKIIRKIWHLYVDEKELNQMKTEVFKLTKHDIDIFVKDSSKKFLIQHFTYKNIDQHNIQKILNPKKLNQYSYKEAKKNYGNNQYYGQPSKKVKRDQVYLNQKEDFIDSSVSTSGSVDRSPDLCHSMLNENHQNCLLILNKLKHQSLFQCSQCGKRFSLKNNLENHKKNHFDQKLINFRIQRIKKQIKYKRLMGHKNEKTINEWTKQSQKIISKHDLYIDQENMEDRCCLFCGKNFDKEFDRQKSLWVYKNTIKIKLEKEDKDEYGFMHIKCYQAICE